MVQKLSVGSTTLIGALERYAERLELLEVSAEPKSLPPPRKLRQWRSSVPPEFTFSLVLPRDVAALTATSASDPSLAPALEASKALGGGWLLLRTPPSVAPSERSRRRMKELVSKLKEPGARIAWEMRGVWAPEDAEAFAEELDIVLVRDIAQFDAPPGPVVYTRLLTLGQQARIGQGAIERVAERLEDAGAEEAVVVVEGRGAPGVARRLRAELGLEERGGDGAAEDEEGEDEDEPVGEDGDGDVEDEEDE
ncbi:MAG TPA: DUF72 domain-containing protein [Polyangiaceae bacterium]|nr:DUF72 domain-containing protein [Polyangiaceae bacterium]